PDVPTQALIEIVASRRADLLCLSVTLESNRKAVDVLIKGLKTIPESPKVIIGGCLEGNGRDWKYGLDGVESATNVVDGVRLARKLFNPGRNQVDLREYLKGLGQRIRSLRQKIGWTQEELAKATKLTRSYLVAVEGGKQNLSMDVVVRVANALNLAPDQLIGRNE
ncbi:MAG: helix-turn-helix domain-containing protein, partial [Candidatus Binatia bacterium]